MAILIDSRFRGPDDSGNGGYSCGVIAREHGGGELEVTLRLPPPLDEWLRLDADGRVWDDHALVAEVREGSVGSLRRRRSPGRRQPRRRRPTSTRRSRSASSADMRATTGCTSMPGRSRVATWLRRPGRWQTDAVGPEFVWAALDCPGAYATGVIGRGVVVLGRLTARVDRVPQAGERCVAVGWSLGSDDRKHGAGTALFSASGELLGIARAVWIEPRG